MKLQAYPGCRDSSHGWCYWLADTVHGAGAALDLDRRPDFSTVFTPGSRVQMETLAVWKEIACDVCPRCEHPAAGRLISGEGLTW